MKHFSVLIRPVENNVSPCVREYYENINDVLHWPTRQESLILLKVRYEI